MSNLKVYAKTIEDEALEQINTLLAQDAFKDCKVRIMPDVHAGKGCVIGFTADLGEKVIPNIVGVDIGCVDLYTEYLTPHGWKKISEYGGEPIAVFDADLRKSFFEVPVSYIKAPCGEFFHLKTKYGIDQMLSAEHKCLLERGSNSRETSRGKLFTISAHELVEKHNKLKLGFRDNFICDIPNLQIETRNSLSDAEIRVQVMVAADGHLCDHDKCVCTFKKMRKIERCRQLLEAAHIDYSVVSRSSNITAFRFAVPVYSKDLTQFYDCSIEQLKVICDEVMHWDGNLQSMQFVSKNEADVGFIQYAFAATGHRTSIDCDSRGWTYYWRCSVSKSVPRVQLASTPKRPIKKVASIDGYKYCFTTSTGFWIMRRNGCICVTGNCGMLCVSIGHGDIDFEKLDNVIRTYVPSGRNVHDGRVMRFDELQDLHCYRELRDTKRIERSIGTLGGGNHFIEIDVAEDGYKYLVIHTGSRNLGKQVADYYQNLAYELMCGKDDLYERQDKLIEEYKAAGRKSEIESAIKELRLNFRAVTPKLPKDLCYLEGKYREQYLHDMRICQKFAYMNRVMIAQIICNHMGWGVGVEMPDYFECIHNYIDHGSNIVRKGAISAKYGEKVLIPINMRDGCILGTGKGNEDWNCSAPHGAGRLMSRMKAKETLSMSDYSNSMDGIYTTSVSEETIDEAPMAYKPIEEIMDCIKDTVDILAVLKPVYNFKASE